MIFVPRSSYCQILLLQLILSSIYIIFYFQLQAIAISRVSVRLKFIRSIFVVTGMKAGSSSLNPYAASYIPLSKRAGAHVDKEISSAQELNKANGAAWFGRQGQHRHVSQSYGHNDDAILAGGFSKPKVHHGGEFYTSSSRHVNEIPEKSNIYEEMDMAYLQMNFPGISYESLHGVYLTNKCDLDASVDMIHMLEIHPSDTSASFNLLQIHPSDTSDTLPDTLDIGDVPEPLMPTNQAATSHTTEKKATGFASTSSQPNMPSTSGS